LRGIVLAIDPCIPRNWPGFSVDFRYHSATYKIVVENPHGVARGIATAELDGNMLQGAANIPLADDGAVHNIRIVLG
jgi:cyclic beta-1,2-glucan synthetase